MNVVNALKAGFVLFAAALGGCGAAQDGDVADEAAEAPAGEQQHAWTVGNWSGTSSSLAAGAFTTGNSSLNLPVCRAAYDGGWQPGKYWQGQCLFEWGGQKHAASQFQTLVNNGRMSWYKMTATYCSSSGCINQRLPIPQNAIDGGLAGNSAGNVTLGVCKAKRGDQWHPGKWYANKCNIEWDGGGLALDPIGYDAYVAISN
jgi:hypothetical protein